jgi:hypothetical protein
MRRDHPSCGASLARVRVREKENRTLVGAIAELREHLCLGPELHFDYTLSSLLRKAWARPGCEGVLAGRLHISPDGGSEVLGGAARSRNRCHRTGQGVAIGSAAAQLLLQAAAAGTPSSGLDRSR